MAFVQNVLSGKWGKRGLALYAALFLGLVVIITVNIRDQIIERERASQTAVALLTASLLLDQSLGFGGLIHNFKNSVLRPAERARYVEAALEDVAELEEQMSRLRRVLPEAEEAILAVETTIAEYAGNLEIVSSAGTLDPLALDARVRVDDTDAIFGLTELLSAAISVQEQQLSRIRTINLPIALQIAALVCLAFIGLIYYQWQLAALQSSEAMAQDEFRKSQIRSLSQTSALVNGLPIYIGIINQNLKFELINRQFETLGWQVEAATSASVEEVFSEDRVEIEAEIEVPFDGSRTVFISVSRDARNSKRLYLGALDITERKEDEKRLRAISSELDHRVKNVLALVSAIAYFTAESTSNMEEFQNDFSKRIAALSRTHQALSKNAWSGAHLHELIEGEVNAFASNDQDRIKLSGPDLVMSSSIAQDMTLVFHELMTNAVKYGAFSSEKGKLAVTWSKTKNSVKVTWTETGVGLKASEPAKGFGLTLIGNTIKGQLKGDVSFDFKKTGLACTISIPTARFST